MDTSKLPIVIPNLTQRGEMDDKIIKMAMLDLYQRLKDNNTKSCTISLPINGKFVELKLSIEYEGTKE